MNNRLTVLAADIQAAHEDICQSNKYSAGRAVEAGRLLAEAKADENIPRGGWERWVENVAHVPYSTAQHYISLFRAIEKQSLTLEDIAEAGQIGALKAVADEIKRREQEDDPATPGPLSADELERQQDAQFSLFEDAA